MSAEHEDHGHTSAAWTLVGIVIVGFTVGGVGVVFADWTVVIVGVVICVVGIVVGKAMQMMGMGAQPKSSTKTS
ncbi:MAG: hypothetical protein NTU50_07200 [Actinobacteria bacterium]|nr:hypothetical protein [Actinomycetota bacterium]